MDCRVVVEAAVPVYDVGTPDEAVRIAISKTGEMLNPDLNYVEINMSERVAPGADEHPAFIVADEALVALDLEMTVFNVEREEHASRIARKEIGQRLENIPLKVMEVEVLDDEDDESSDTADDTGAGDGGDEGDEGDDDTVETAPGDDESANDGGSDDEPAGKGDSDDDSPSEGGSEDDEDPLPEFEDLL